MGDVRPEQADTASAVPFGSDVEVGDVWHQRELEARHDYDQDVIARSRRLLAEVAHDFRTPLAVMTGLADMLDRDDAIQGQSRLAARAIAANARRLAALVDGLLDAETREAGDIAEEPTPVDLQELISEVAADTELLISRGDISVTFVAGGQVTTQREGLRRLLLNLTANAVRNTSDGTISVTADQVDGGARVTVEDTGRGMTPDEIVRFREAFVRGEASSGFGLGLSIVTRLADVLGARLEVSSERGVGTRFTLLIPDAR